MVRSFDAGIVPVRVQLPPSLSGKLPGGEWRKAVYVCHFLDKISSRGVMQRRVAIATSGFICLCDEGGHIRRLAHIKHAEALYVSQSREVRSGRQVTRALLKFGDAANEPSVLLELPQSDSRNDPGCAADPLLPFRIISALRRGLGSPPLAVLSCDNPLTHTSLGPGHGSLEKRRYAGYRSPAEKIRRSEPAAAAAPEPLSPLSDSSAAPNSGGARSPSPPVRQGYRSDPAPQQPRQSPAACAGCDCARLLDDAERRAREAEVSAAALQERLRHGDKSGLGQHVSWKIVFGGLRATGLNMHEFRCSCTAPDAPFCPSDGALHHDKARRVVITVGADGDTRSCVTRETAGVVEWDGTGWLPLSIPDHRAADAEISFALRPADPTGAPPKVARLPVRALLRRGDVGYSAWRLWHQGLPLQGGGTLHLRISCALKDAGQRRWVRQRQDPPSFDAAEEWAALEGGLEPLPPANASALRVEDIWGRTEPVVVTVSSPQRSRPPAPSFRRDLRAHPADSRRGSLLYTGNAELLEAYRKGRGSVERP
eukprot:TRINITY_DN19142_c0_g1_i1.p1 TRINITY_DN19142_c0_g1~~TRINITY_DN19142_c0_g1_i1.p1  ORF type:complete len:560 (+),score=189.04 TRINITY_DN19142_c0_g1_i1:63-1682(+)